MSAAQSFLRGPLLSAGILDALRKLDPRVQIRNPVMFVVYVGSLLTTGIGLVAMFDADAGLGSPGFVLSIAAWLWLTVLFANFAEALAEGRGKAQAAALRSTRRDVQAKKLHDARNSLVFERVSAASLRLGDHFLVSAGEVVPADGE